MSDERHDEAHEERIDETSSRPPPRNPFAEPDPEEAIDGIPALIEGRRSAAIAGVVAGLVMLVLVVGLCVVASIAFG